MANRFYQDFNTMAYTVTNQNSGRRFTVNDGETVLDAAIRQGISLAYGCRSGLCGSCQGKVLQGEVSYDAGVPPGLTEEERAEGTALFCSAMPKSDLVIDAHEINVMNDIPVRRMPCKVSDMDQLADDVMRVFLKLPADDRLQFMAGQYIEIILKDERRRAFSLANPPHDDAQLELHIRNVENGEFTDHVFKGMHVKDILRIEGPMGSFFLREDSDRPIIFMAGGTGFAPIKSIIEHAFAENMDRPMYLYWGARTSGDLYLHELAQQWAADHENFHYVPVLSQENSGWQGRTGYVNDAILEDFKDLSEYDVYTAGPPVMVNAGAETFPQKGLSLAHYYSDAFEYAADTK
jgi:CDP-4-dehydro-6-deoxyglucose reductase